MGWSTSLNPDPPTITYSFITYIPFISIVYICVHDSHKYSYKLPLLNYYYLYLTSIIYIYIHIVIYIYHISMMVSTPFPPGHLRRLPGRGLRGHWLRGRRRVRQPWDVARQGQGDADGELLRGWEKWEMNRLWMVDMTISIYIYIYDWECWDIPFPSIFLWDMGIWKWWI